LQQKKIVQKTHVLNLGSFYEIQFFKLYGFQNDKIEICFGLLTWQMMDIIATVIVANFTLVKCIEILHYSTNNIDLYLNMNQAQRRLCAPQQWTARRKSKQPQFSFYGKKFPSTLLEQDCGICFDCAKLSKQKIVQLNIYHLNIVIINKNEILLKFIVKFSL